MLILTGEEVMRLLGTGCIAAMEDARRACRQPVHLPLRPVVRPPEVALSD
jgi:hypothetical protein